MFVWKMRRDIALNLIIEMWAQQTEFNDRRQTGQSENFRDSVNCGSFVETMQIAPWIRYFERRLAMVLVAPSGTSDIL